MGADVSFKIAPHVIAAITATWAILRALVAPACELVDQHRIMRRGAFIWVLAITGKVITWTLVFADTSARPGMEVAAIIGAVWAPLAVLQGAIFKFYDDSRSA